MAFRSALSCRSTAGRSLRSVERCRRFQSFVPPGLLDPGDAMSLFLKSRPIASYLLTACSKKHSLGPAIICQNRKSPMMVTSRDTFSLEMKERR
jgi:hypothetical protein